LFRGFKENNIFNRLFFLIYMFRIGVPMLIAVSLKVSPLTVALFQVVISLGMLAFLFKMKPFTKRINYYQTVLFESIVLLMNCCMFALTVLSETGRHHTKAAIILGDIVIIGNDVINLMCLVFLVIKLYNEIRNVRNFIRINKVKGVETIGLWVQILFVPLQLGNMGFEEMVVYDFTKRNDYQKLGFRRGKLGQERTSYELQNDFSHRSFDKIESNNTTFELQKTERVRFGHEGDGYNSMARRNGLETFGDFGEDMSFEEDVDYGHSHQELKEKDTPPIFQGKSILKKTKSQESIPFSKTVSINIENPQQISSSGSGLEGESSIYRYLTKKDQSLNNNNFENISNLQRSDSQSSNQSNLERTKSEKGWRNVRKNFNPENKIRARSNEKVEDVQSKPDENIVVKLWQSGKMHF